MALWRESSKREKLKFEMRRENGTRGLKCLLVIDYHKVVIDYSCPEFGNRLQKMVIDYYSVFCPVSVIDYQNIVIDYIKIKLIRGVAETHVIDYLTCCNRL